MHQNSLIIFCHILPTHLPPRPLRLDFRFVQGLKGSLDGGVVNLGKYVGEVHDDEGRDGGCIDGERKLVGVPFMMVVAR
jgi:hypothetical protein